MKIEKRKINELIPDYDNARMHGARNISAIKESLISFSQYCPIVIQEETGMIIAGNGTYMAAKELGWEEIDCAIVSVDNQNARIMSIVDNRSTELSNWDTSSLLKVLMELEVQDLSISGYTEKELEKLIESTGLDQKTKEIIEKIKEAKEYVCPKCGKTFSIK